MPWDSGRSNIALEERRGRGERNEGAERRGKGRGERRKREGGDEGKGEEG